MIAAFVLAALVASAQALPGRSVSEELTFLALPLDLLSQTGGVARDGDINVVCLIGYIDKGKELIQKGIDCEPELIEAFNKFRDSVRKCFGSSGNKYVCFLQSVRDAWEGSAELQDKVLGFADEARRLILDVAQKCFGLGAADRSRRRILM